MIIVLPMIQVYRPIGLLLELLGMGAIAYLVACLCLWWQQSQMIFLPSPELSTTPADFQVDYEDVWLPLSVGGGKVEQIHGWWIPSSSTASKNVLLFLHGNTGNMGVNVGQLARLYRLGFSVLSIDYRGYGRSQGRFPSESRVYEDAEVAWNYLINDRGVSPENLIIYGYSLGGAIAIELVKRQQIKSAGLIIEGSFTSMRDMSDYRYPKLKIFPINLLLTQRFDSLSKLRSLQRAVGVSLEVPTLFIHGLDDEDVPAYMSQQLFDAALEPKQLFLVPEAKHDNVASIDSDGYVQTVNQFVELALAKKAIISS